MTRIVPQTNRSSDAETKHTTDMEVFVQEVTADLNDIEQFYNISFSPIRLQRLEQYLSQKLEELRALSFDHLPQQGQVDWLALQRYVTRRLYQTKTARTRYEEMHDYLHAWTPPLMELCEWRQKVIKFKGETASALMSDALKSVQELDRKLRNDQDGGKSASERVIMNRAAGAITELHRSLHEMVMFYREYDPVLTWWLTQPWNALAEALFSIVELLRSKSNNAEDQSGGDIIGQPLGRDAILAEIEAECLPYSPEELIRIGESEFKWCEGQMELASKALGYDDPKKALEHTKNTYVEPGEQIYVMRDLAREAVDFVVERDMITVPRIADECWRTIMIPPEQQKVSPFFLGGTNIMVAYPTSSMSHEDKMMSMRANSPPFSRAVVFHELIPGHHLQFHYMERHRPYRKLFQTPFWIEGWALYWEFILWDRGFPAQISQTYATNEWENRIGMLFWRMHRCARIIFSIKFHLGQMSPNECVDFLVDRVGHERATAEGEVRRSFNGDYSPLYQAGYMLGALQLYKLREELLGSRSKWTEKEFHDRVLKENNLPIELLRALLKGESLSPDWNSRWRFYDFEKALTDGHSKSFAR